MPKKKKSKGKWSKKIPDKYLDSALEKAFYLAWRKQYPRHVPAREFKFHPSRQYRFDFAWPRNKIAVEIQGYGPGHFSVPGMTADCEKGLEALLLNWRVIYLTSTFLLDDNIKATMRKIAKLLGVQVVQEPTSYTPLNRRRKR